MIKPQIVNKLKSINELQLLMYFSTTDRWEHTQENRTQLAESLSIAEITLKVALKSLKEKGLIDRVAKGIYKIHEDILQ